MTSDKSWLAELCYPEGQRLSTNPWKVIRHGHASAVATDGRVAVLLEGGSDFPEPDESRLSSFTRVLDDADLATPAADASLIGLTVAALREWTGPAELTRLGLCPCCGGDGQHECGQCETEHDCGVCEGTGGVEKSPEPRPGYVAGLLIDRNRLARVLAHLDGPCEVRIGRTSGGSGGPFFVIAGYGWTVIQMPMYVWKYGKTDQEHPTFGAVAAAGKAAMP